MESGVLEPEISAAEGSGRRERNTWRKGEQRRGLLGRGKEDCSPDPVEAWSQAWELRASDQKAQGVRVKSQQIDAIWGGGNRKEIEILGAESRRVHPEEDVDRETGEGKEDGEKILRACCSRLER